MQPCRTSFEHMRTFSMFPTVIATLPCFGTRAAAHQHHMSQYLYYAVYAMLIASATCQLDKNSILPYCVSTSGAMGRMTYMTQYYNLRHSFDIRLHAQQPRPTSLLLQDALVPLHLCLLHEQQLPNKPLRLSRASNHPRFLILKDWGMKLLYLAS